MSELVTNAAGQQVPKPNFAWKPINQMTGEERREYNRLRAEASRKKRKQEEELLDEQKGLKEQEEHRQVIEQAIRPAESPLDDVPVKWAEACDSFLDQVSPSIEKIAAELGRTWLYSFDVRTIRDLQRFIYAVENKYIQLDEYCRVMGEFPEVLISETAKSLQTRPGFNRESDAIDLKTSKTFMEIYRDALWKAYSLNDPKYTSLMDSRMWGAVKAEFERVCQS